MSETMEFPKLHHGFTLIELSIVLVIIGLIVGGVLVGQDLIKAAEVRATISQIEKFNTAANTFYGKYGYLPGDIKDPEASSFGFAARGTLPGEGDGNGVLEGYYNGSGATGGSHPQGELGMFWVDLTTANGMNLNLIDGSFSAASPTSSPGGTDIMGAAIATILPPAKLGRGNYFYAVSGGFYNGTWQSTGINYFGMSAVNNIAAASFFGVIMSTPGLTVQQAYAIDKKMDDGFPQTGNVTAQYENGAINSFAFSWASGGGVAGASDTSATAGSPTTCYDNGGVAGAAQHYSVEISNGSNVNCALMFKFQ